MGRDNHKYSKYINNTQETRWAREDEIKKDGDFVRLEDEKYPTAGLPLLADTKQMYVDGKDSHSLIFGATGSKKTRLFCLPMVNLFAKAGESFIVTDPKGEIYAKTSGLVKANGYKTIVLNFRDPGAGDMWNPMSLPYRLYHSEDPRQRDMAMAMTNDLIKAVNAKQEERNQDNFWPTMTHSYLLACTLLMMECFPEDEVNFATLSSFCEIEIAKKINDVALNMDTSTIVGRNLNAIFSAASKTKQSILATTYSILGAFNTQKSLIKMLSNNTVDLQNIGKEKTAIYLMIPDEKTTLHFLAATFIKQAYEVLIGQAQKEPDFKLPIRVNFLMDEFCNMPKIADMPAMISAARSRNMRFFLVAQSKHQLVGKYGEDAETIKGNCDNWVFLTSKELALLREISDLCGAVSLPNGVERRLISTSELQRLDKEKGEALIIHARQYPFITTFPDIDQYDVFKGYPAAEMNPYADVVAKTADIEKLYREIRFGDREIPFAKYPDQEFVHYELARSWM